MSESGPSGEEKKRHGNPVVWDEPWRMRILEKWVHTSGVPRGLYFWAVVSITELVPGLYSNTSKTVHRKKCCHRLRCCGVFTQSRVRNKIFSKNTLCS
jgi:hypothetical protein